MSRQARAALMVIVLGTIFVLHRKSFAQDHVVPEVLLRSDFERDDAGWSHQGKADFGLDGDECHGGRQSTRITVAPNAAPQWQQWWHEIPGIAYGDEFQASVWVRTKDAAGGTGAYFALEYLDADGRRCGISHSTVNLDNGRKGWQRLTVEGLAATGARRLRVNLILNAHGTAWFDDVEVIRTGRFVPWPDLGNSQRTVTIDTKQVVQPNFAGVGYHVFHHVHPISQDHWEQVVGKRWRELNPSFARMNHSWDWSPEQVETVARHMAFFQTTGTQLYLATWGPKDTTTDAERKAYARLIVDELEYLVRQKGLTNIRYYCMTNELSLVTWGKLARDLPKFRDYHQALYDELQARKLDIKLLATDASPISFWDTIQWAAQNMDEITGIYGGHHYVNDRTLDDERFYPWFLAKMQWGVGLARAKHKDFVLGEFGSKQDGRTINGVFQDRCIYFDTPLEPQMPIQVSEAAIAAINAGSYALGYWTFMDFPDQPGAKRVNKWGLFKWSGHDYSTRPIYYAYGLLSKFFRGPSTVYRIDGNDPRLRVAAVEHHDRKTWSIAVVNRSQRDIRLVIRLDGTPMTAHFRKYVYNPARPPANPFGDLQEPVGKTEMSQGRLTDTVAAGTLVVYTTAYRDHPPSAVKGLTVTKTETGKLRLEWQPNTEPDLCYYRIYRSPGPAVSINIQTQIASTIATGFVDTQAAPGEACTYRVVAVDQSGNAGESEPAFPPFLFAAEGAKKVIRYGRDGAISWEYPAEMARDVWQLPGGNVLFCYNQSYDPRRQDNPSGVMEVTPDRKIAFRFSTTGQVWSCQRLPDGNTLVGASSQGKLLVVNPHGTIVREIKVLNTPGHSCMRNARQVAGGNYLVAEESAHAAREYSPAGNLVREIKLMFAPYSAVRLKNGNTLVCGQKSIVEIDPGDKLVWSLEGSEIPQAGIRWFAGIQVLPNDNLFVCNAGGRVAFLEIDRNKRIVWQSNSGASVYPLGHGIHRVDVPDPAEK